MAVMGRAIRVDAFKAGCGCTQAIGFAPADLAPGAALPIRLRVTPGEKKLGAKTVKLTATLADGSVARSSLAMDVVASPAAVAQADR